LRDPARNLSDNMVLAVMHAGETIEATQIPYRYVFAQSQRPELFVPPLKALAVSGILLSKDRYVLGRRAQWVSQDPGALELVPSGSVDADLVSDDGRIDLKGQFDEEVSEELGIGKGAVGGHSILGLVDDVYKHVMDVVVRAKLTCTWPQLVVAHSRLERPEYSDLVSLTKDEIRQMIERGSDGISEVSTAIFTHFCAEVEP
jgi:hypothetical protein